MMLARTFDPIFARYGGRIPVAFLRALSYRESGQNPSSASGPAKGLMQTLPALLEGYNQRHGTQYGTADLLNPEVNVAVATDLLNRIVLAFGKHPSRNLKADWSNPEFLNLLTAGWNSGYSEGGGVGRVATFLESRGIPVTHDNVFQYAAAAGATKHLQNDAKQQWQKSVTALYFTQPDRPRLGRAVLGLLLAAAVIFGVYKLTARGTHA